MGNWAHRFTHSPDGGHSEQDYATDFTMRDGDPDGRKIQVKTRVLENRVTMFGRQYHDDYDAVFLLALTGDYEVVWAAELTKEQVEQCSGAKRPEGRSGAGTTNIRHHKILQLRRDVVMKNLTDEARMALAEL